MANVCYLKDFDIQWATMFSSVLDTVFYTTGQNNGPISIEKTLQQLHPS